MRFNRQIITFVIALSICWLAVDAHAAYESTVITAFKDLQVLQLDTFTLRLEAADEGD